MNTKPHMSLLILLLLMCTMPVNAAQVIKLEVEIGKNDSSSKNTNIITVDDKKVRVDYLGTETEKTDTTPYLLTLNAGKSWVIGNRDKDEFYCADVNMDDFFRDIGDIVARVDSFTNAQFSNNKVAVLLQQPGPEISGYATTHIRLQTTANIKASILLKKFGFTLKKVDDIWYAKNMEMHEVKKRWIEALTNSGYEVLDQLSRELRGNITGPILKQKTVMQITNTEKNQIDTYIRKLRVLSVQDLKSSEVSEKVFAQPRCKKIKKSQTKNAAKTMFKEGKLTL
ncbi:MAG: hypothetical protein ACN4GM_02920 [Gammaproteobacteria bacterium]